MDAIESLRMAWRAVRSHRLRSGLTTLGVVIGVGAVITFVVLGASLQGAILGDISAEQSLAMTVTTQQDVPGGGPGIPGEQSVFTEHDIAQVDALDDVATVVPEGTVALSGLSFRGQTVSLPAMTATTPDYFDLAGRDNFSAGGPFQLGQRAVVLNRPAARMFETNVTVGETVTVTPSGGDPIEATVVGILVPPQFQLGPPGVGKRPAVYAPTEPFYENRLVSPTTGERQRTYAELTVTAMTYDRVDAVADRVEGYFAGDADAQQLLPSAYRIIVQTQAEFVAQIREILNTFTGFITGIAVISLLVGAIGIANIMLVSVTERTREIGIMKAVGFQNRDVLQLFLVEALVLGILGSVFGIGLGIAGGFVATSLLDLPFAFPVEWAAIAVLVGMLVGVVSGLYPAWNGARIDPIEALRYE